MSRNFRIPRSLGARLEERGINVPAVLRRAALPRDVLEQPRVYVTTDQYFALWQAIRDVSGDPAVSLKLGIENKIERLSPIGIALVSTENFGQAVQNLARYKRVTSPEAVVQKTEGEEWSIQFRWLHAVESEPPVLIENCFAWLLAIARLGSGRDISPLRVEFLSERTHVKTLERFFGCPVLCGGSRNALVFRASDAKCPFVTRNAELFEALTPQFDRDLKRVNAENSFIELVQSTIQEHLTGQRPTVDVIARALHVSSRTLQRRLQESGFNFQHVLNEARRQVARYYLSNSALELSETAYLLGYEDTDSFVRAFRTWEGVPPGSWREAHRHNGESTSAQVVVADVEEPESDPCQPPSG